MKHKIQIEVPNQLIANFCLHWKIKELAFFGSVLRADFGKDSDIDILVSFFDKSDWSLFDLLDMKEEWKRYFPAGGPDKEGPSQSFPAQRNPAIIRGSICRIKKTIRFIYGICSKPQNWLPNLLKVFLKKNICLTENCNWPLNVR